MDEEKKDEEKYLSFFSCCGGKIPWQRNLKEKGLICFMILDYGPS